MKKKKKQNTHTHSRHVRTTTTNLAPEGKLFPLSLSLSQPIPWKALQIAVSRSVTRSPMRQSLPVVPAITRLWGEMTQGSPCEGESPINSQEGVRPVTLTQGRVRVLPWRGVGQGGREGKGR